jgi:hypothetical protein
VGDKTYHTGLVLNFGADLRRGAYDQLHRGRILAELVGGGDLIHTRVCLAHVLDYQRHVLVVFIQEPEQENSYSSFLQMST